MQENLLNVMFMKLLEDAKVPMYSKIGDAGCDLHSVDDDIVIQPFEIRAVGTGIAIQLPEGAEAQVRPRSGWAIKHGLTVVNSPGTIDCNYRGEILVGLINLGKEPLTIKKFDRIAQLVIAPVYRGVFYEVDELAPSNRNADGFGSTGLN